MIKTILALTTLLSTSVLGEDYSECWGGDIYKVKLIGDGKCHIATNTEECGWDGGDCCELTCDHDNCGVFWGYTCKDPSVVCEENKHYLGDGKCHEITNTAACGYDGGDCCEATCEHEDCGVHWGYRCMDPSINQYAPECNAYFQYIGDGLCHSSTNNEECGYDGGDCCESTCVGTNCGNWGYHCNDPSAVVV